MIIQSKRNEDKIIEVSIEEWNKMKRLQLHRHWRVVSSSDLEPAGKVPEPDEVFNFMNKEPEVKKIYDEQETDYNLMLKSELLLEAENRGVDVSDQPKKAELIERLVENNNK